MSSNAGWGLSRPWLYALLALALLLLLPLAWFHYLPLNDWPNHLASMDLLARWQAGLPTYVQPNPDPLLPNASAFWFLEGLGPLIGVENAGRLLLALTVALMMGGAAYFMRALDKRLTAVGAALGAALAYNWFFLMGFLNFALGIPLFLFAAGYWVEKNREKEAGGVRGWMGAAALAILTTLTHLIAGLVLVSVIVTWREYDAISHWLKKRNIWAALQTLRPGLALDLAVVVPTLLLALRPLLSFFADGGTGELTVWGSPFRKLLYLAVSAPEPAIFLAGGLVLGIYLLIQMKRLGVGLRVEWVWVFMALNMASAGILTPENTASWQFASPRFWPFFIFFAAAAVLKPLVSSREGRGLVGEMAAGLVVLALLQTAMIAVQWESVQAPLQAIVSAGAHLREGAAVLPLGEGFAMQGPQAGVSPYFHAWGYWVMQKGVYVPYIFAWSYSPVQMKDGEAHARGQVGGWLEQLAYDGFTKAETEPCGNWKAYYRSVNWSVVAREYDYVVMRTGRCENESLVPPPFVKTFENGSVSVFENKGRNKRA